MLTTLVLWSGMIRELHCIPRILDLVAATGLRCGLVVTVDSLTQSSPADLALLAVPEERGGVLGRVELLLGSTGRGVCAEGEMDEGELGRLLTDARAEVASMLPPGLMPRGWWPLVDAPLVPGRTPRLHWEEGHPVLRISPRPRPAETPAAGAAAVRKTRHLTLSPAPRCPDPHCAARCSSGDGCPAPDRQRAAALPARPLLRGMAPLRQRPSRSDPAGDRRRRARGRLRLHVDQGRLRQRRAGAGRRRLRGPAPSPPATGTAGRPSTRCATRPRSGRPNAG